MFSIDLYLETIKQKELKREKRDNFSFGIAFGTSLLFIAIFRLLTDNNINHDNFYFFLLFVSLIDYLILIFMPNKIKYLKISVSFIFKFFFRILLSLLLLLIYIIWFIPSSIIYNFHHHSLNTNFIDKKQNIIKITNNNIISQLKQILAYFVFSDNWYLLPLLIILIIIGLILFVAQSSAITPLIYPLI